MDPPAIDPNPEKHQPQGRQVCLVLLREVEVRPFVGDGRDSTFSVEVASDVVDYLFAGPDDARVEEGASELDHEQFTGLAFSISPRVATKGNDEPLNGQDVLLVALGDSQCTVSNTAVVHGAEKVGFAHLESRRSSKDYT